MSIIRPLTVEEFLIQYENKEEALEEIDVAILFATEKFSKQNEDSPTYQTMLECLEVVKLQIIKNF